MTHGDILRDVGRLEPAPAPTQFVALQRVLVRLLFDPHFVERVYTDPHAELSPLGIEEGLARQLVSNDRRIFGADALRRSRALQALMEEFKITTTLVLAEVRRLSFLESFFSSEEFHVAVQERRYLALAFAEFLVRAVREGQVRRPQTSAVLQLEGRMARSRRLVRDAIRGRPFGGAAVPGTLVARPGVLSLKLPVGILAVVQHVEAYLFRASLVPALVLCEDAPRPEPLPPLNSETFETWLLEPGAAFKVELSGIPAAFHEVILACEVPTPRGELSRRFGADRVEALLEHGVLQEGGDPLEPSKGSPSARHSERPA